MHSKTYVYNTYRNGLNLTKNGKSREQTTVKFNTIGHRFSDESKQLMRKRGKERYIKYDNPMLGKRHSKETKQQWQNKRKGYSFGRRKLNHNDYQYIYRSFVDNDIAFADDLIGDLVKSSQRHLINQYHYTQLIAKNGKYLTYKTVFIAHFARIYDVNTNCIRRVMDKKGITAPDYA